MFEDDINASRVFVTGIFGSGKTHTAKQIADATHLFSVKTQVRSHRKQRVIIPAEKARSQNG